MLTLVAVLLHPPSALPLCYLLCCSLFILCSGKDLPWSHWCCLHKRQNSIWCKALWWRHHRMFFWGKIRGKKRMMPGWWWDDLPLLPFIQCIILHLIDLNLLLNEIRVLACLMCGEKKTHRDMQTIFPRIYSSNDKQKCGFVWNETSALKLNIPRNKCFDCSKICNLQ